MRIEIAERLRPYSHVPGEMFVLPGSFLGFQMYPAIIKVYDLSASSPKQVAEHPIHITGPTEGFTILQDLEKGVIRAWGQYKEGFLRYRIISNDSGKDYSLSIEKMPPGCQLEEKVGDGDIFKITSRARLSLGSHKAQDCALIGRRADLADILPIWFKLGKITPDTPFVGWEGTLSLLRKCQDAIAGKEKLALHQNFLDAYKAGFEGALFPRLIDNQHQGYECSALPEGFPGSALLLLTEGAKLIQDLFVAIELGRIGILETLPPQFHCGRFVDIECRKMGMLSMEWSKKTIRRMAFISDDNQEILFQFQHGLKRFRLKSEAKDRGEFVPADKPIIMEKGQTYFFDNFQS